MISKKLSLNILIKNELTKYIPSPSTNKHMSYAAAVSSNSNSRLNDITSQLHTLTSTDIPQGHPDTAATGMFLTKQHKHMGAELPHTKKIGCTVC